MPHIFDQDKMLWDDNSPFEYPYSSWTFSANKFYIGDKEFTLKRDDNDLAAFELGFFDVHYTRWKAKVNDRGYFYHSRLRSAIEEYFNNPTGTTDGDGCFTSPPILQPWLWRTFCLCPHGLKGRLMFLEYAKNYGILMDGSQPPLSKYFWIKSIRSDGFTVYLPKWLDHAKHALGIPQLNNRLHCWQFDCFSCHFPDSLTDQASLHFPHNSSFVFLTSEEKTSQPWTRLMSDPTILRTYLNNSINLQQLERLKPDEQLNCDIINMYNKLCCSQRPNGKKMAVVSTFFWPNIDLGESGYDTARRLLFRALTDSKMSKNETKNISQLRSVLNGLETLLIPINYHKIHWLLFIADLKAKRWLFYDSANRLLKDAGRQSIAKAVGKFFQDHNLLDCSTWETIDDGLTAAQQVGENDCGVFMCQFTKISLFKSYSDVPSSVSVSVVCQWRQMMVLELESGKIRWETD